MFTTILMTLAVASTPVTDSNTGATAAAAMTAKSAQTAAAAPARKPTSYCIVDTLTGSRIPTKVCKTRDQWLSQGFDPLTVK